VGLIAVVSLVVVAAAAVGVGWAVGSGEPTGPASTTTATAVVRTAVVASDRAGSFHYVAVYAASSGKQTTIGAAGVSSGTQRITVDDATLGTERFSLLLVGAVVYFRGNAAAVAGQLGITSASAAATQANRWISLHRSDAPYDSLEEGITSSSALSQVVITPQKATATTAPDGRPIWRVTGDIPAQQGQSGGGSAGLDVDRSTRLPRSYVSTSSGSQKERSTFTFSQWGRTVTVSAPSGAVPFSTIASGATGGGGTAGGGSGSSPSFST
jgi:hypothetical protein